MAKLFVICGHGAGDVGACGHGFQEYERVRVLGKRIKELSGDNVMLGDINRNYFADNGISNLNISKDYQILELHLDSSVPSAKGGHVIIQKGLIADKYDNALANYIASEFSGRAEKIKARDDLVNPQRAMVKGYGYRLLECCFISNKDDITKFNKSIDKIATNILKCFNIAVSSASTSQNVTNVSKPTTNKKSVTEVAKEVINGKWGNGAERTSKLTKCGYNAQEVQKEVNRLLGVSTTVKKSVTEIAKEVIDGKWGNGAERKTRLEKSGYNYNEVQAKVNQLLK